MVKRILFKPNRSSLNLLLVLPVFLFFLVGCALFPSLDDLLSQNNKVSCITADSKTLVISTRADELQFFNLSDGKATAIESPKLSEILCTQDNDVISIQRTRIDNPNDKKAIFERTAVWKNSSKAYQLAPNDFSPEYIGIIQKRYIVSSWQEYVEKSRREGSGNRAKTVNYKEFTKPHVFSIEDSNNKELKNYSLEADKLGLKGVSEEKNFRIHPLSLSEEGNLLFLLDPQTDSPRLYKIEMLRGKITQIGEKLTRPTEMILENAVADKAGKFVAIKYDGRTEKGGSRKIVKVLSLENNTEIISRIIEDVSFNNGSPLLIFEQNAQKLAIISYGFKFEPTRSVSELIVLDLQNGNEISNFDAEEFFQKPESVKLEGFVGDELIFTYRKEQFLRKTKFYLSKMNLLNKQIIWTTDLDEEKEKK